MKKYNRWALRYGESPDPSLDRIFSTAKEAAEHYGCGWLDDTTLTSLRGCLKISDSDIFRWIYSVKKAKGNISLQRIVVTEAKHDQD